MWSGVSPGPRGGDTASVTASDTASVTASDTASDHAREVFTGRI
jgi:hypothetical protein